MLRGADALAAAAAPAAPQDTAVGGAAGLQNLQGRASAVGAANAQGAGGGGGGEGGPVRKLPIGIHEKSSGLLPPARNRRRGRELPRPEICNSFHIRLAPDA